MADPSWRGECRAGATLGRCFAVCRGYPAGSRVRALARGPSRGRRPGGLDRASTLAGRGMVLFGQLLRQLRTSAGLSQLGLCQDAGLSIRIASDLERAALTWRARTRPQHAVRKRREPTEVAVEVPGAADQRAAGMIR